MLTSNTKIVDLTLDFDHTNPNFDRKIDFFNKFNQKNWNYFVDGVTNVGAGRLLQALTMN